MTPLHMGTLDKKEDLITTVRVREFAQQEALERLLELLDPQSAVDHRVHPPLQRWDDPLHRQARLRAARASYVLSTSDEMARVSSGAWVRRRHI